jgi:hypothetical protein
MNEKPQTADRNNHPYQDSDWPPEIADDTDAPSDPKTPKGAIEQGKAFTYRFVGAPLRWLVLWLHQHDGLITALATVAIAYLTISLAGDSARQADTTNGQLRVMQSQLTEMQSQSAIQRAEMKAVLRLQFVPEVKNDTRMTPVWTNAGKSNANGVKSWGDIAFIKLSGDPIKDYLTVTRYDFINIPERQSLPSEGDILISGEQRFVRTSLISPEHVRAAIDGKELPVVFGYVEYSDIFNTAYTVRYCASLHWELTLGQPILNLPAELALPCNRRTETGAQRQDQKE